MRRTVQLLVCALLINAGSAFADAITGGTPVSSYSDAARANDTSSQEQAARPPHFEGAPLFDASGASILLMSAPQFFFPGAHPKLRGGGGEFGSDGSNGGGGGSLIPGGVLTGLNSGVPSGTLGNVGFNAGGSPTLGQTSGPAAIVNPEPASLILLGTGLVFCARRLKRRQG